MSMCSLSQTVRKPPSSDADNNCISDHKNTQRCIAIANRILFLNEPRLIDAGVHRDMDRRIITQCTPSLSKPTTMITDTYQLGEIFQNSNPVIGERGRKESPLD